MSIGYFVVGTKTSRYPTGTTTGMKFSKHGYPFSGLTKPTLGISKQIKKQRLDRDNSSHVKSNEGLQTAKKREAHKKVSN